NAGTGKCVSDAVKRVVVYLFIVGERGGAPSGRCHPFPAGECPSGADGEVSVAFMPDGMPSGAHELLLALPTIKRCPLRMFSRHNRRTAHPTRLTFSPVNLQFLREIARFTVALQKIFQRCTTLLNRTQQHRFNHPS